MRSGGALISALRLSAHPEGGWYRRTWEAPAEAGARPAGSAILYLLLKGERSAPHRIDATELWHFYAGDPLELRCEWPGGRTDVHVMGPEVLADQEAQVVVPPGIWQTAHSLGSYSLMGATVCPAFTFDGFELWEDPPGSE
jgi:uncharacterized protein